MNSGRCKVQTRKRRTEVCKKIGGGGENSNDLFAYWSGKKNNFVLEKAGRGDLG